MTLKEYNENTSFEEKELFAKKLHTWLGCYTSEVVNSVITESLEEILDNKFTLKLIDELYERTVKEEEDEIDDILFYMTISTDTDAINQTHNHPMTHSSSYRNVLYDMYIKGI